MVDNSIINLGELSKPATALIEKISDAVGGIFKPYQIIRVAKAEIEADRLRAESQIQISDLHRRALHRFLEEEAKKQKNIEEITQKALPQVEDKAAPDKIEDDWITNFFDKCRLISDSEMQSLWSRVLSGEANAPGSYSKRTVNFLSSLDKRDAEIFARLCTFKIEISDVVPMIYDLENEIYTRQKINFNSLSHLESIGLIQFDGMTSFGRMKLPEKITVRYYGETADLEFPGEADNSMNLGMVLLTQIGQELAPICGSSPDSQFLQYLRDKWKQLGYISD